MENVKASLDAYEGAHKELHDSLDYLGSLAGNVGELERGIATDAVIKRFEVAFEYAWKLMKAAAEYQGSEVFGPRPAIQEAIRYDWIHDPDFWADALDARNGSVHDYFGVSRDRYLEIVREFLVRAKKMTENIKKALA
jgi:nucleotidyltransferase substrate binding protein (TIGR01987 family)